jgi:hypothetical protein
MWMAMVVRIQRWLDLIEDDVEIAGINSALLRPSDFDLVAPDVETVQRSEENLPVRTEV